MRRTLAFLLIAALLCACVGCGGASASYDDEAQIAEQSNTYDLSEVQQAIGGNSFAANVTFEGMDTLWSVIYDLKRGEIHLCPQNPWHREYQKETRFSF